MFLYTSKTNSKKNFFWNMTGSMCNALSSMILLSIVTRAIDSANGGIFSLAFSTAQLLQTVGCFETRVIQASDTKEECSFSIYFTFRLISSFVMMLLAFGYILKNRIFGTKAFVILVICLYKAIDAISDSCMGLYQQKLRIDMSGKSLSYRVIISTISFAISCSVTKNLVISSIIMVVIETICFFLFDITSIHYFADLKITFNYEKMKSIFLTCIPLCIGSFMISYILNAPKYAIDKYLGDVMQNYYGFIMMPAFVINLFSLFVFRPLLTTLAIFWNDNSIKKCVQIVVKCCLWIVFLTVAALIGSYLMGIWILNLISGLDLSSYRIDLVLIMFGGGLNAFIMLFYNVLAVIRKQNIVFIGYLIGFSISLLITSYFVSNYMIRGAAISYIIPQFFIASFFLMFIVISFKNRVKKSN